MRLLSNPAGPHAPVTVLVCRFAQIIPGTRSSMALWSPMLNVALEGAIFINASCRGDPASWPDSFRTQLRQAV